MELFKVFLFLFFLSAARVIVMLLDGLDCLFRALRPVDEVKLVHLTGTDQGEVVLATLVVDTIELSHAAVSRDYMRVPKQAPDLAQGQREGLLALSCLNFLRVKLVPVLKVGVVTQEDVLALLFDFGWVGLKVDQVLDVNELTERVLLDLLLGHVRGASLW